MIAGRLNEIVNIFSPTVTVNEFGERVETMDKTYSTRARVVNNSGGRQAQNSEIVFTYQYEFNLRSYVPVKETDQIEWQGNKYRILTLQHRREYNDIYIQAEKINE